MTRSITSIHGCALLVFFLALDTAKAAEDERRPSVGMPARIDGLVLPGSELIAKPIDDAASPIVLRIVDSYPHGTAYRYDLVYYGLEPGEYDLRDFLERKDGSAIGDVPALKVEIRPLLPPGQVEPNPLGTRLLPALGGYRTVATVAGIAWGAGLLFILFYRRKKPGEEGQHAAKTLTLAERLKPYIDSAIAGTLTKPEQAELERMLLSHWRGRLGLQNTDAADAIVVLKEHPEAGVLLKQLERWLHHPDARREHVDVAELLEPYRDLPEYSDAAN